MVEAPWQEITKVHKKRLLQYHFPNHILHTDSALASILSLHMENSASGIQNLELMHNASLPHGSDVEQFYIINFFLRALTIPSHVVVGNKNSPSIVHACH